MQESFEVFAGDLPTQHRVHDRPAHRIVRTPTFEVGQECVAPGAQPVGLLLIGQRRSQIVDDFIGVPREAIQRVDVGPLARRKQQGREVVGLAMSRIEFPAPVVGGAQLRIGDPCAVQIPRTHASESIGGRGSDTSDRGR